MKHRYLASVSALTLMFTCFSALPKDWKIFNVRVPSKVYAQTSSPDLTGIVYVLQGQQWQEAKIQGAVGQFFNNLWNWQYNVQYLGNPDKLEQNVPHSRIRTIEQALSEWLVDNIYNLSTPISIELTLEAHNQERRALNLSELSWSVELSQTAQSWAEELLQRNQLEHSITSQSRVKVGENLTSLQGFTPNIAYSTPERAVGRWLSERDFYDYNSNLCISNEPCGHYTQIIWEDTTEVGCGVARTPDATKEVWVCQYSPAGNIVGQRPY